MRNIKNIFFLFCFISYNSIISQKPGNTFGPGEYNTSSLDALYKKFYRKPLNLDSMEKAVAVTGKRIWRIVDFTNPDNKNIFTMQAKGSNTVPMFEILLYGLYSGKILAYKKDVWGPQTKYELYSLGDLNKLIFHSDSVIEKEFDHNGEEKTIRRLKEDTINSTKLKGFIIGEDWYMDKHFAEMRKRIVTICPVWYNEKLQKEVPLFWLYYPECRDLLSSFEANNPTDKTSRITWDQLLQNKWFHGIISRQSNIFDRNLNSYKKGDDVLIESYKTKEDILSKELDYFNH